MDPQIFKRAELQVWWEHEARILALEDEVKMLRRWLIILVISILILTVT